MKPGVTCAAIALNAVAAGAPNEQWVHLLPAGRFQGKDGRGPWTVANMAKVIEASRQAAGTAQIPVDYDHQTDFSAVKGVGGTAPAAGWIKGLQARDDGIWALTEWTGTAAAKLANREYRYISPVFTFNRDTGVVGAIKRAGLTNNPNLNLTAVAASGDTMDDQLADLRTLLDLAEDAPLTDIIAAVKRLMTTQQSRRPDPSEYVPIAQAKELAAAFVKLNQGISLNAATQAVAFEIERGRLPPAFRAWAVELCTVNKPKFDEFVSSLAPVTTALFKESNARNPNGPPGGESINSADEDAVFASLGLTPQDLKKYGRSR